MRLIRKKGERSGPSGSLLSLRSRRPTAAASSIAPPSASALDGFPERLCGRGHVQGQLTVHQPEHRVCVHVAGRQSRRGREAFLRLVYSAALSQRESNSQVQTRGCLWCRFRQVAGDRGFESPQGVVPGRQGFLERRQIFVNTRRIVAESTLERRRQAT